MAQNDTITSLDAAGFQVLTSAKRFTADDLTVTYVLHAIPVSVLGMSIATDSPRLRFDEVASTNDNTPIWHSQNWFPPGEMTFDLIRQTQGAG
jgi:hypothetical protein